MRPAPHPRTVSHEVTLPRHEVDRAALETKLGELAGHVEATLARERLAAKRLVLKVRYADDEETTRSRTEKHALARAPELLALAADLLARTQAGTRPIRGLGLAVSTLVQTRRDDRQLDLFARAGDVGRQAASSPRHAGPMSPSRRCCRTRGVPAWRTAENTRASRRTR